MATNARPCSEQPFIGSRIGVRNLQDGSGNVFAIRHVWLRQRCQWGGLLERACFLQKLWPSSGLWTCVMEVSSSLTLAKRSHLSLLALVFTSLLWATLCPEAPTWLLHLCKSSRVSGGFSVWWAMTSSQDLR